MVEPNLIEDDDVIITEHCEEEEDTLVKKKPLVEVNATLANEHSITTNAVTKASL